jgi:hypothetical protein
MKARIASIIALRRSPASNRVPRGGQLCILSRDKVNCMLIHRRTVRTMTPYTLTLVALALCHYAADQTPDGRLPAHRRVRGPGLEENPYENSVDPTTVEDLVVIMPPVPQSAQRAPDQHDSCQTSSPDRSPACGRHKTGRRVRPLAAAVRRFLTCRQLLANPYCK